MGGRYVGRLHYINYINVQPPRNKLNFKMSLKNRGKFSGGVLPSMHKALHSIPSTKKKKKRRKWRENVFTTLD